ncbi:MAG: hypothetical protein QXU52_05700 [Fervidicoccaceae archaeon]
MLKVSVNLLVSALQSKLHASVKDAGLIHRLMFAAFLQAGLERKGMLSLFRHVLDKVESCIPQPHRAHLLTLSPYAAEVIRNVEEAATRAVVTWEASVKSLSEKLRKVLRGKIGYVYVVDALSPIEFASLLVVAKRNGYYCDLSSEYLVNPAGKTWFVKEQVEEKRLREYAKELAESLASPKHSVSFTFDKAIHNTIGDVSTFLNSGESGNPLHAVWREVEKASSEVGESAAALLLTTDHGYGVYEGAGTLFVDHGREGAILDLEPVALIALLKKVEADGG